MPWLKRLSVTKGIGSEIMFFSYYIMKFRTSGDGGRGVGAEGTDSKVDRADTEDTIDTVESAVTGGNTDGLLGDRQASESDGVSVLSARERAGSVGDGLMNNE